MIDLSKEKLHLNYPCKWIYKLIGLSKSEIEAAIIEIIQEREYKLSFSHKSKKGKFISYNLELLVHNDDDRTTLYELFGKHSNIKMVL